MTREVTLGVMLTVWLLVLVGIGGGVAVWIARVEVEWRTLVRGYLEHRTHKPIAAATTPHKEIPPIAFPADDDRPGFRWSGFQPPVNLGLGTDDDETLE